MQTLVASRYTSDAFIHHGDLRNRALKHHSALKGLTTHIACIHNSTWNVIGLEMEGAHYQKAIQSASKIRGNISENVQVRYAYYASDNPLETGATLASGGLGMTGVTPTYAITQKILEQIFTS